MSSPFPSQQEIERAVSIYLEQAYPAGIPVWVKSHVRVLETWGGELHKCPVFVANAGQQIYSIRLGNVHYPHMKLRLELAPDGSRFLYRADTHDRHVAPAQGSPEHAAFVELSNLNQRTAEAIEAAWENAGFATFRSYLRDDLKRRRGEA